MEVWLSENWHLFLFFTAFGGLLWRVFSRYSEMDKRVTLLERDIKHGSKQFDKISSKLEDLQKDVHQLNSNMQVVLQALKTRGFVNGHHKNHQQYKSQ